MSVAVPKAGAEIITLHGGSTTLRRCPPGFAKSKPGQYRCFRCTQGSVASAAGSVHCHMCPYGTTSDAARTSCGALAASLRASTGNAAMTSLLPAPTYFALWKLCLS